MQNLLGKNGFLSPDRLSKYNAMRNDPCSPKAVSTLSAYLHFGHISPQRVAFEASKHRKKYKVCFRRWSLQTWHLEGDDTHLCCSSILVHAHSVSGSTVGSGLDASDYSLWQATCINMLAHPAMSLPGIVITLTHYICMQHSFISLFVCCDCFAGKPDAW